MHLTTVAVLLGLTLAGSAHAAGLGAARLGASGARMTDCIEQQSTMKVADTIGEPRNCCDGQLRCAQYLATTKLARGQLDPHT